MKKPTATKRKPRKRQRKLRATIAFTVELDSRLVNMVSDVDRDADIEKIVTEAWDGVVVSPALLDSYSFSVSAVEEIK